MIKVRENGGLVSCRDQEGRRGSEEAVPGPSVFPSPCHAGSWNLAGGGPEPTRKVPPVGNEGRPLHWRASSQVSWGIQTGAGLGLRGQERGRREMGAFRKHQELYQAPPKYEHLFRCRHLYWGVGGRLREPGEMWGMCRQEPRQTGSGKTQPKELHSVSGWICSPVAKHRPLPAAQGTEASGSAPGACGWTHPKGAGL